MAEPEDDMIAAPPVKPEGLWHTIALLPTWVAAATLFFLMTMTFLDVLLRSVINAPIEAAPELTRFSMAIIVFASLPMVTWRNQHIVVDLMDPLFSRALARIRDILIDLACGLLLLWPAKRVYDLAERSRSFGDVSEYLGFPVHVISWFIAGFALLTALVFIARGLLRIFAPHRVAG